MHDATKVLLGATQSSDKEVSAYVADPTVFKAGYAVRAKADGGLQLDDDDTAALVGVSLGADLSDCNKTVVCRAGNRVPLRLKAQPYATGTITISNVSNLLVSSGDIITVGTVGFVAQAGAATPGEATFQAAVGLEETAASLAAQILAHADTMDLVSAAVEGAVITLTALEAGEDGNSIILTYTDANDDVGASVSGEGTLEGGDLGFDTLEIGAQVYVDEVTGDAVDGDDDAAVATSAVYVSGALTGVYPDGTTAMVALIDMSGGL